MNKQTNASLNRSNVKISASAYEHLECADIQLYYSESRVLEKTFSGLCCTIVGCLYPNRDNIGTAKSEST